MAIQKHDLQVLDSPTSPTFTDRVIIGQQLGVANAAGGGAGLSVTTVVTFPEPLPANYTVFTQSYQDCTTYVTAKTTFGFSVVQTPRLAANTLAAGTFDVLVIAA